jgi:adenylate kinase
LEKLLAETGQAGALAVNLNVGYNNLIRRLTGRRTCKVCGEIYNIYYRPPKQEGRCDRDGGELLQRPDDREEVIRERHEKKTRPLVDFYLRRQALLDVEAEGAPEELTERLLEKLAPHLSSSGRDGVAGQSLEKKGAGLAGAGKQ